MLDLDAVTAAYHKRLSLSPAMFGALREENEEMLTVLDALWAEKDAPQTDNAACRRLYNAWLNLRDVRNKIHERRESK